MQLKKLRTLTFACLFAFAMSANALTINTNFTGGAASAGQSGGGSLQDVFRAAADWWESAIQDTHTLDINFGWQAQASVARHSLTGQGGTPNRETSATIQFDNDATTNWFMDSTPFDNSEFGMASLTNADLGGGVINTGVNMTALMGSDAVSVIDAFSVALHEIGHALGMSSGNTSFVAEAVDGDIDVTAGIYSGSTLGLRNGAHLDLPNSILFPFVSAGERTFISQVDLLANCSISQFTMCDYTKVGTDIYLPNVAAVPEPSTVVLLVLGLVGVGFYRRRVSNKNA